MTWPDFFLICFLVGFLLSMVSLLTGHLHLHLHHHPGGGVHLHGPHAAAPAHSLPGHAPAGGHGAGTQTHAGDRGGEVPWLNFGTISAFLAWFGGAGYLATHYYHAMLLTALAVSLGSGLLGAGVVFVFLAKVLMNRPEHLDPADFDMIGVLGTVSGTIRNGGTGEILFLQQGARKAVCARSEGGDAIPKGIEVVVTRYENGIAYVRRWDELTASGAVVSKEQ